MFILIAAVIVAALVACALSFGPFARSVWWRATVTPLASIIGSGFLICGPLLAREFGSAAILAEAALLAVAYAVGAVMRFNIAHVEPFLAISGFNDRTVWLSRVSQGVLSLAYAISVAYYLKLLAAFGLRSFHLSPATHGLLSNGLVTMIIVALAAVALLWNISRVEHVAHASVALKLGVIAGLLLALALFWIGHRQAEPAPPVSLQWKSVPILLGLLITVQGFETSRFLGHAYSAETRIRTMKAAQCVPR